MALKKKVKKEEKKIKKLVVTIVAYLAGYDSKIREEEQLTLENVSKKEMQKKIKDARQKLKDKLVKDFGGYWKGGTKRDVRVGKSVKVKTYEQHIVLKGKDYGVRKIKAQERIVNGWTSRQEQRVLLLKSQGYNWGRIAKGVGRTYESVRSKGLRLQGKKKK